MMTVAVEVFVAFGLAVSDSSKKTETTCMPFPNSPTVLMRAEAPRRHYAQRTTP